MEVKTLVSSFRVIDFSGKAGHSLCLPWAPTLSFYDDIKMKMEAAKRNGPFKWEYIPNRKRIWKFALFIEVIPKRNFVAEN